jgi:tRNA pseudouridine38-40 synthase
MNEAAALLLGKRDFSCFCKAGSDTQTMECNLKEAVWTRVSSNELHFRITADRFLRNMVRAVVGSLLEVGQGNWNVERMNDILDSRNRSKAGTSVPACGLYLHEVIYPFIKKQ